MNHTSPSSHVDNALSNQRPEVAITPRLTGDETLSAAIDHAMTPYEEHHRLDEFNESVADVGFESSESDGVTKSATFNCCVTETSLYNGIFISDYVSQSIFPTRSPFHNKTVSTINALNDSWLGNDDVALSSPSPSDSSLMTFCQWYQGVHGYLSIVVCSFGIVANLMNIIVLTRKVMVCIIKLSYMYSSSDNV
jgi:hypothetical protein